MDLTVVQALPFDLLEVGILLALLAGAVLIGGGLLSLGAFAYRSLVGDGIEYPDEEETDDGLRKGDADDEWDYY